MTDNTVTIETEGRQVVLMFNSDRTWTVMPSYVNKDGDRRRMHRWDLIGVSNWRASARVSDWLNGKDPS